MFKKDILAHTNHTIRIRNYKATGAVTDVQKLSVLSSVAFFIQFRFFK